MEQRTYYDPARSNNGQWVVGAIAPGGKARLQAGDQIFYPGHREKVRLFLLDGTKVEVDAQCYDVFTVEAG